MSTNALQANYGAKAALTGNVGAQDRAQEVLTPDYLVEAARLALGGVIMLDPCATLNTAHHVAVCNWHLNETVYLLEAELKQLRGKDEHTKDRRKELNKELKQRYLTGPGLTCNWLAAETFVNHPYKYSKEWMEKIVQEAQVGARVVNLCPVRPWRSWWVRCARMADECVWLAPVAFKGHKQPAPMPMCMLTYGCRLPNLGKMETGRSKI